MGVVLVVCWNDEDVINDEDVVSCECRASYLSIADKEDVFLCESDLSCSSIGDEDVISRVWESS